MSAFVMFYSLISDPIVLNTTIDIGRAIIYKKLGVDLQNMEVDVDNAIIKFYDDNGEVIQLVHDSINLDNYTGYRLIFDYNVEPCNRILDMYPNIKTKSWVLTKENGETENIPVVHLDFQPIQIIDEINMTLWSYRQNNIFCIEHCENIADKLQVESVQKGIYKSDRFTIYDFVRSLIDEIPQYTTKLSFGNDLLKICYVANKIWADNGYNDIIHVLSDGSVRIPLSNINELDNFELEMSKMMKNKIDLYSISLTMEMLEAIQSLTDKGYIGGIGNKKYLIDIKPIKYFSGQEIEKETVRISSRSKGCISKK